MHKKRIGDKDYFYTSVRDNVGKVKTIYLGSNKRNAIKKEKELGLSSGNNKLNLHVFFTVLLLLVIGLSGFFLFTGLNIANVTEIVESDENSSSLGEGEVSVGSLEDVQPTTLSNETSSSLIENNDSVISETVEINESNLNISLINESMEVNLSVENVSISNLSKNKSLNVNLSELNISLINESLVLNQSLILNESVNMSVRTLQYDAVINQPVKWKKKVLLSSASDNVSINIPKEATNISVTEILNGTEKEISSSSIKLEGKENTSLRESVLITGSVVSEVGLFANIFTTLSNIFSNLFAFTGYDVVEIEEGIVEEEVKLIIEEEVEEVEIEYQTPGPNSTEINITEYSKQIIVSSDIHYENILAFTEIKDVPLNSVNLYWIINGSRTNVEFLGYDTNDNNLVDYVEWIVPSLSNQTYEIEINVLNIQSYPNLVHTNS